MGLTHASLKDILGIKWGNADRINSAARHLILQNIVVNYILSKAVLLSEHQDRHEQKVCQELFGGFLSTFPSLGPTALVKIEYKIYHKKDLRENVSWVQCHQHRYTCSHRVLQLQQDSQSYR
jgi:hydrogenase-4 membrane subunit HyfE